jgi:hypothetical protein
MDALPVAAYAIAALIPIALACILAAWLIRSLSGGGKKRRAQQLSPPSPPVAQAQSSPVQQARPPAAPQAESTPPTVPTGDRELLSIVRTEEGGLSVLAGGQPYRRLRDINDPRVGQDTIEAIRAILAFAEGWLPFIQEWSAEVSEADASSARAVPARQPDPELAGRAALPHASTMAIPPPGSMLTPLPLIDEVNDLVQKRLREDPDLADHLITLSTALDGSLRIYVDQQVFQAVGDITNPKVKALIQGAIREWEGGYH